MTWLDDVSVSRGDAIAFGCEYDNRSERAVIEGPTARDHEMCMFFAGYYPRMPTEGADACSGAESGPVFSGSSTCAQAYACLESAPDEFATERCWGQTSETSTASLLDFAYRCAFSQCGELCDLEDYDKACTACLADRCADEWSACAAVEK